MDVGKWAFDNKKLVYFLIVVLLVGGLYSAYDMSKLEDPEIKVKMAMVVATRPGRQLGFCALGRESAAPPRRERY